MARSKMLHKVTKTHVVTQPANTTTPVVTSTVDFALELSRTNGRNIRQGHSFRVVGFSVQLQPTGGVDMDMGMSIAARANYCPTTYHTAKAWREVFSQWRKQKALAGKVGTHVNYDDMELAYDANYISTRTSSIRAQGIGDMTPESLCIFGNATDGSDFPLQDYYNSQHPIQSASKDPFTNVTVKDPKYTVKFPSASSMYASATMSAMVADLGSAQGDAYFGGNATFSPELLPADNHINVLCGIMEYDLWVNPPDTASQNADAMLATVTWLIEGWTPLIRTRKPRRKVMKRKPRARKTYRPRVSRYSRKRRK